MVCERLSVIEVFHFFLIFDNGKLFNAMGAKIVNSKVGFINF